MSITNVYDQFIEWYESQKPHFHEFSKYVLEKISKLLPDYKILTAIESAREKDIDKLNKKCRKKVGINQNEYKYSDPKNQITDLAGARIVAYVPSDVPIICKVIENLFNIDQNNSCDKHDKLESDKVGYLSIHYIVSLNQDDPKYNEYKDMKCEIQVRTVLQHAWAQIFHDRQYKPIGNIQPPDELIRKTNLVAGSLELLDTEIDSLVQQYNEFYNIFDNASYQSLLDENVSEKSLREYLFINMGHKYKFYDHNYMLEILSKFKIKTIRDFEHIFNQKIADEFQNKSYITIDHIIMYMIITKKPTEILAVCDNNFSYTQETINILNKYTDIDLNTCIK